MANVIRLVNGGSIQVRTGVIQGIGPRGSQGVQGVPGPDGPTGPQGETGPMGQILQQSSLTRVQNNNPIPANTDTVINWGSVAYDNMSCFKTGSIINGYLDAPGDYLLSTWLRFDDAAATIREVWFQSSTTTIARTSRQAVAGSAFYVDLAFPFHTETSGIITSVYVRSATATGVSMGSWAISRIGSGPKGDQGIPGIVGPTGEKGDPGIQGPAGNANTGFAKYSDMLPH